jgi:5'(3')-deoxyribonucleotidase
MIINIDIDNTTNDFIEKFVYYLNGLQSRLEPISYTFYNPRSDIEVMDITNYKLSLSTGVRDEILETMFFRNNAFYETLEPLENAVETIRELVDCGNEVRFVTAIRYDVVQARIDFVRKYFPFINPDTQLIVTNNKESIYADIVIEDCLDNLKNVNKDCRYIVFSQPWNIDKLPAIGYPVATECKDWFDIHSILRIIGALKQQKGGAHIYE